MNKYEAMTTDELRSAAHSGRIGVGAWREQATREDLILALTTAEQDSAEAYRFVAHPAAEALADEIEKQL